MNTGTLVKSAAVCCALICAVGPPSADGALPLDTWTYIEIDNSHGKWFGCHAADIDGDGYREIVAGQHFYKNPGGDMTGTWTRSVFPAKADAFAITDIDGDNRADVVATGCNGTYWFEAADAAGTSWTGTKVNDANQCTHSIGPQGAAMGQVFAGGASEFVIPYNGVIVLRVPANPGTAIWPTVRVHSTSTQAVALGDIDNDGDLDIAGGEGTAIWWASNPGSPAGTWSVHALGTCPNPMDRIAVADLDGDGRLDVVITEEANTSGLYWYRQGPDPATGWTRTKIASGDMYLSMDVGDLDADGDCDVVTGEALANLRIQAWANNGSGQFAATLVADKSDINRQTHIGCRLFDLDGDGDLDLVNNSWTTSDYFFVWRNDAGQPGQAPAVKVYQNEYSTGSVDYLLYIPKEYLNRPGEKWPLLLYLHGAGQMGSDPNSLRACCLNKQLDENKKETFPFVVVSPQCPGTSMDMNRAVWWPDATLARVNALLDQLVESLSIDNDRVYVAGSSMGGYGTWKIAIANPGRFAAIGPSCGEGDPSKVCAIRQVPTWAFHGSSDGTLSVSNSDQMVAALQACGGDVKYTRREGQGHNYCWQNQFDDLYAWFLTKRRSGATAGVVTSARSPDRAPGRRHDGAVFTVRGEKVHVTRGLAPRGPGLLVLPGSNGRLVRAIGGLE